MTRSFDELSARARATWTDDTRRVHDAASAMFHEELDARAVLGRQLRAARQALGLTQPELAELTAVQQSEISRIENGHSNPTLDTVVRLAQALSLSLALTPSPTHEPVGGDEVRASAARAHDLRDHEIMKAAWG